MANLKTLHTAIYFNLKILQINLIMQLSRITPCYYAVVKNHALLWKNSSVPLMEKLWKKDTAAKTACK